MAKQSKKSEPWDDRGLQIHSLDLSFIVNHATANWRELASRLGFRVEDDQTLPGWEASFVALPSAEIAQTHFLSGEVHTHSAKQNSVHWIIRLKRQPSTPPPETVIKRSQDVGGFPAILGRLAQQWPADLPAVECDATVTYNVNKEKWRFSIEDDYRRNVVLGENNHTLTARIVEWNIDPPAGFIKRLITSPTTEPRSVAIGAIAKLPLTINAQMIERVDELIWNGIVPFFVAAKKE